jgi:arylsulfatase A-like enzyme
MTSSIKRRDFIKFAGGVAAGALLSKGGLNWLSKSQTTFSRSDDKKPLNVILIVLDTVRAKSLSLFGYERLTSPLLTDLSQRGVLFRNTMTPSPWTLPAHASMFTGQWPNKLGVGWSKPLDDKYTTLAEVLRNKGYQTAGFAANKLYCSRELGLARGFEHFEDYRLTFGQMVLSEALSRELLNKTGTFELLATDQNFGRKSAQQVNKDFLNWLSKRKGDKPFFAFLNYFDAHDPYLPPIGYATAYSEKKPNGHITQEIQENHSPEDLRQLIDAYDGVVTYLDNQVGRLIEALSTYDWFQNTLLILTSDHGEQFGEHNLLAHANSLYLELLHVFLILIFPGKIPIGQKVDVPVSLRNLPATILDQVGIQNEGYFPGHSLARYWNGSLEEEQLYSYHKFEFGSQPQDIYTGVVESLIFEGLHYIQDTGGIRELYNIRQDPNELNNLVLNSEFKDTVEKYQGYLKSIIDAP